MSADLRLRLRTASRAICVLTLVVGSACIPDETSGYRPGSASPAGSQIDLPEFNHRWKVVDSIGVVGGNGPYVFGGIGDAVYDDRSRVVVLDSRLNDIRSFGADGNFLESISGSGDGPLEYRLPIDIDLANGDTLLLLDEHKAAVLAIPLSELRGPEIAVRSHGLYATSFCSMSGRVFLAAWDRDRMIHEIDEQGRVVMSFGEMPLIPGHSSDQLQHVRRRLAQGRLACDPESRTVLFALDVVGTVFAFRADDGRLLWRSGVPGFHPMVPVSLSDGRTVYAGEGFTGWHHRVHSLVTIDQNTLAVQVKQAGVVSSSPNTELVETFLLDLFSGNTMSYTTGLPILLTRSSDALVAKREDWFPRILLLAKEPNGAPDEEGKNEK